MDINKALEKTGKARWHRWIDEEYVYKKGPRYFFVYDKEGREEPYNFDSLLDNNWQPYPPKEGIRPEKTGELWEYSSRVSFTFYDYQSNLRLIATSGDTSSTKDIIHNQNGWKRIFPVVEEEDIERIVIEPELRKVRNGLSEYKFILSDDYGFRVDGRNLILEIPKEDNG